MRAYKVDIVLDGSVWQTMMIEAPSATESMELALLSTTLPLYTSFITRVSFEDYARCRVVSVDFPCRVE